MTLYTQLKNVRSEEEVKDTGKRSSDAQLNGGQLPIRGTAFGLANGVTPIWALTPILR